MTFDELKLNEGILRGIKEMGFTEPSPIQEKTIPLLLNEKKDYVGLAQTGTGKTAAFGLPLIQAIDPSFRAIQGLILCPTRELCIQITREMQTYSKYVEGVKIVAVYGGASIQDQIRNIKKGVNIIVGTPGRTIDLMQRAALKFDKVSQVVLDEADEMLNMGFKEDIDQILKQTPTFKNTWLFSATMPKEVERIARNYMENPEKVTIGTKNSSAANIEHQYCFVNGRDHYHALKRFVDFHVDMFAIVFCRTRRETKDFAEKLVLDGYNADALHGDLTQSQRDNVMRKFRNKTLQVLIATDVAARGIDVNDVTHVFHIDLPDEVESYTHRSGRTARAGKSGMSISLVSPSKKGRIRGVEKQIGKPLTLTKVPDGKNICGQQLVKLISTIKEVEIDEKAIEPYLENIYTEFSMYSKEILIQRFVSVEFNRFLKNYGNAKDLNISGDNLKNRPERKGRENRRKSDRFGDNATNGAARLFLNVGKKDGFENNGQLLGFICNKSGVDGAGVGKIDLMDTFSFISLDTKESADTIIQNINGQNVEGREVKVEFSNEKPRSSRGKSSFRSGGGSGGRRKQGYGEKRKRY